MVTFTLIGVRSARQGMFGPPATYTIWIDSDGVYRATRGVYMEHVTPDPESGGYRTLEGLFQAYGLTSGGWLAKQGG